MGRVWHGSGISLTTRLGRGGGGGYGNSQTDHIGGLSCLFGGGKSETTWLRLGDPPPPPRGGKRRPPLLLQPWGVPVAMGQAVWATRAQRATFRQKFRQVPKVPDFSHPCLYGKIGTFQKNSYKNRVFLKKLRT